MISSSCPKTGPAVIAYVICTHTVIFDPPVTEIPQCSYIICYTTLLSHSGLGIGKVMQ